MLCVLDDFEWNLEPRDGSYVLKPESSRLLEALIWAIRESYSNHRIIITCRYDFDSDLLQYFYKQGLEGFHKTDLEKKLKRLPNLSSDKIDESLRQRSLRLADGNPRLLEWLDKDVLSLENPEAKLSKLEVSSEEWKGKITWEELYQQIEKPLERVLSHCLVFDLFVPMSALEAVCQSISDYKQQLQRAIDLGFIETSSDAAESDRTYLVPKILNRIISDVQLPEEPEVYTLYRQGLEELCQIWLPKILRSLRRNWEIKGEEEWREIFRLIFSDKGNPERFTEPLVVLETAASLSGNTIISVLFKIERLFLSVLKIFSYDLLKERLYDQLAESLKRGEWKDADRKTTLFFYLIKVLINYNETWKSFLQDFPKETLKAIDELWIKYSQGHFGFSTQKQIWEGVGGDPNANIGVDHNVWTEFATQVGWRERQTGNWRSYEDLDFTKKSNRGHIPSLLIIRHFYYREPPTAINVKG